MLSKKLGLVSILSLSFVVNLDGSVNAETVKGNLNISDKVNQNIIYKVINESTNEGVRDGELFSKLKINHYKLPSKIQSMVSSVSLYNKEDGILGRASGRDVMINSKYIYKNYSDKSLSPLYYHEVGHVVDYNSFNVDLYSRNLLNNISQEYGRYNYSKGVNYSSNNFKVNSEGYRMVGLKNIESNKNYLIQSKNNKDVIILLLDENKNVTRFVYGLYKNFKTESNEKYITFYSVKKDVKLNDLKLYKVGELDSLSRDKDFKILYKKLGYRDDRYLADRHEIFAKIFGSYYQYKSGYISKKKLLAENDKNKYVILYMDALAKNNFKDNALTSQYIRLNFYKNGYSFK